jgi:FkbM family methyltransferase
LAGSNAFLERLRQSRRVAQLSDYARGRFGLPPRGELESYARLSRTVGNAPRYQPGLFEFPFGPFRYLDGPSLQFQYLEIFVERGYDFECAEEAPLIVDCGGNVGLSVVRFKQQYPRSRVVVFEADPAVAEVLKANVTVLHLQGVEVRAEAVWHQAGAVPFLSDGADSGRVADGARQVPAARLADEITEPVALLKMDIEGAEYAVLRDLCESGKIQQVRRLICEVHSRADGGDDLPGLLSALQRSGFLVSFSHARSAPDLPGRAVPTPFSALPDGKCLLHLYAWQAG